MKENILYVFEWGYWGGIHSGVLALSKEFSEFNHYAIQLNQNINDEKTDNLLINNNIYLKKLNGILLKEEVRAVNPKIIFLFTIQSRHIEKPVNWLENYTVVKFHNSCSKNDIEQEKPLNVYLNWVVSDYQLSKHILKHDNVLVSPPVTFIKDFLNIERSKREPVVGRVQGLSCVRKGKYPKKYFEILDKIPNKKFLIGDSKENPPIPGKTVEYLKEIDIFIIWADNIEAFPRAITEANLSGIPVVVKNNNDGAAEQIKKSGGGILVNTEEEFINAIELLSKDKKLRDEIANKGKYWCIENCSTKLVKTYLNNKINQDNYNIHNGYKSRSNIKFLNTEERTDEYQNDVYELAHNIAKNNNYKTIVDFGCGSAFKLFKYFNDFKKIGYDLEETINFLKTKYPNEDWRVSDFSKPILEEVDLLICADVIEHLINPNELINWLLKSNIKKYVISTPDRNLIARNNENYHMGPPWNEHHIREWSFNEFNNYIGRYFKIIDHISRPHEVGQVIICEK